MVMSVRPDGGPLTYWRHGLAPPACADIQGTDAVALSEIDRNLLERCLQQKPRAWEDFVDRFMGLVIHVVNHTAQARNVRLTAEDRDDFCGEVFLGLIKDDFAILRHFRGHSSLATYLTVIARRVVVKALLRKKAASISDEATIRKAADHHGQPEQRISDHEEITRLLGELREHEAAIVRMYHLDGKSYQEISEAVGVSENSIGPILSRARNKMRKADVNPATG